MAQHRIGVGNSPFIILCLAAVFVISGCGPQAEEEEATPTTPRGSSVAPAAEEPEAMPVPPDEPGIYLVQGVGTLVAMPVIREDQFWGQIVRHADTPSEVLRTLMVIFAVPVAEEHLRILVSMDPVYDGQLSISHSSLMDEAREGRDFIPQRRGDLGEVLHAATQRPSPTYRAGSFTGISLTTLAPRCWLLSFQEPLPAGLFAVWRDDRNDPGNSLGSFLLISKRGMTMEETLDWFETELAAEERRRAAEAIVDTPEEVLNEMLKIATALEMYVVDSNQYLMSVSPGDPRHISGHDPLMAQMPGFAVSPAGFALTSPIAYVSSVPVDPYSTTGAAPPAYVMFGSGEDFHPVFGGWLLMSPGPDGDWDLPADLSSVSDPTDFIYDATNGTDSSGDLLRGQSEGIR